MTDNLPAVPDPRPSREIATQDVDSWATVMAPLIELANRIYDTEFVPRGLRGSSPATTAAMLYGREVGLPPMTSLNMLHVVDGKPGLSAEGMRSLVLAAGHEIEFVETTTAFCRMRARRRGGDRWTELEWTIDQARTAGIGNRGPWRTYPRQMLAARCTTELCRMVFPDVIHGFRSVEELEDMGEVNGGEAPAAPQSGSSKVSRRRTTRKRAEPRSGRNDPEEPHDTPQLLRSPGPPLPGEPGYDAPSEPVTGRDVKDAGEGGTDAETRDSATGEDSPSPAPTSGGEVDPVQSGAVRTSPPDPDNAAETAQHDDDVPAHPTGPRRASRAQMRMLWGTLGGFGITGDDEREERLLVATTVLGREVETFGTQDEPALSADEAKTLIDALAMVTPANDRAALNRLLDQYDADKLAIADLEGEGKP